MLIRYFDYLIIVILIFLNIKYWKSNFEKRIGCLLVAFLFGLVLPFVSIIIELQISKKRKGLFLDFDCAISIRSRKRIADTLGALKVHRMTAKSIVGIAKILNPMIRG